jgi:hypothetical protein
MPDMTQKGGFAGELFSSALFCLWLSTASLIVAFEATGPADGLAGSSRAVPPDTQETPSIAVDNAPPAPAPRES